MADLKDISFGKAPFEFVSSEGYITIKLNGDLDGDSLKEFEKESGKFLAQGQALDIVINCENCNGMHPSWVRALMLLHKLTKSNNKKIRLIGVNKEVARFLNEHGVTDSLKNSNSLHEALVEFGLVNKTKLDVNFINPFLEATAKVLKIQCSTEAKAGTPFAKDGKSKFHGDISGVIGVVSDAFTGSVVISFPEATFLKVISKMLGETYTAITPEIEDGAAELTNIIFGQAKIILNDKGYGIKTAIPSVITGKDHSISTKTNGPRVAVPFTSDSGDFAIEISLSG